MKNSILVFTSLLALVIVTPGYSQKRSVSSSNRRRSYCANAESIREMDECQIKIRRKAEAVMNRSYDKFMQNLLDEEQKARLKQSQQAWKKYRDATCDLASSIEYQTCIIEITQKRTIELQEFPKQFLE